MVALDYPHEHEPLPIPLLVLCPVLRRQRHGQIVGTPGPDRLVGTSGAETIYANGGNDTVNAEGGDDACFGDDGDDSIDAGEGHDFGDGGAGADSVDGGPGNDIVAGGVGPDTVTGGLGRDTLFDNFFGSPTYADTDIDQMRARDGVGGEHIFCGANDEIDADPDDIVHIFVPGTCYVVFTGTFSDYQANPPYQVRALSWLLEWAFANQVPMPQAHAIFEELAEALDLSYGEIVGAVRSLISEGYSASEIIDMILELLS